MPRLAIFKKLFGFTKGRRNTTSSSTSGDSTMASNEENLPADKTEEKIYSIQIYEDSVSALHRCKSENAAKLCILGLGRKLEVNDSYDIGGTYDGSGAPELWFYYTTTTLPGYNYLLNLFVCHRKFGKITIEIQDLTFEKEDEGTMTVVASRDCSGTATFNSLVPDQHFYIKTFSFSKDNLDLLKQCALLIHFNLSINPKAVLDKNYVKQIKLNHCTTNIFKDEKADFVLVTISGKKYSVHKILLAAHSTVLRNEIKTANIQSVTVDINDEIMESVLQFLYTGTVEGIMKKNCAKICEAAEKLQIGNLIHLAKISMRELAGGV